MFRASLAHNQGVHNCIDNGLNIFFSPTYSIILVISPVYGLYSNISEFFWLNTRGTDTNNHELHNLEIGIKQA